MKHTKGKWYLQEYTDAYTNIIRSDNGKGFETLYVASAPNREDAKLISKAPEMLETLKDIVERYPNSPWIIDNLKSLINEIES